MRSFAEPMHEATRRARSGSRLPLLVGAIAGIVSLPALFLPFLADDWSLLAEVSAGRWITTPFHYVRPLTLGTHALGLRLFGLSPAWFHLANLLAIAAAAALVTVVVRRYTGNERLAGVTGILFALHPYHVQNAAWVAALADALCTVFFLLALFFYDRWRAEKRGPPLIALALFAAALLAKEAAVSLPPLLVLVGLCDRSRRLDRREWLRGLLPMWALVGVHFLLLRPALLGDSGLEPLRGLGLPWVFKLLAFSSVAILPVPSEIFEARASLFSLAAALLAGTLLLLAWRNARRIPPLVFGAVAAFVILAVPALLSFQERYLFLPSAAAAAGLASILAVIERRVRMTLLVLVALSWSCASVVLWQGWYEAAAASTALISDLADASLRPGIGEVVVANMPHRVAGAPVAANFGAAVLLSGGRPVTVRAASAVDFRDRHGDALEDDFDRAVRPLLDGAEVRLRIGTRGGIRLVVPSREAAGVERDGIRIVFEETGVVRVSISRRPDGSRGAYVWTRAGLERLF